MDQSQGTEVWEPQTDHPSEVSLVLWDGNTDEMRVKKFQS